MEDVQRINRGGPMSPRRERQRTLFDMADLDYVTHKLNLNCETAKQIRQTERNLISNQTNTKSRI